MMLTLWHVIMQLIQTLVVHVIFCAAYATSVMHIKRLPNVHRISNTNYLIQTA